MEYLIDELLLEIFSNIDASTLLTCACVSKRWLQISNTQLLWKRLVLKRWPSQRWLYSKVEVHHLNWALIFKEFTQCQWYSPDEMKYFTYSSTFENELVASSLRQAMFEKMESVTQKWMKFEVLDHDENMVSRYFNQNMELYFNTYFLNWVFTDKRRGYLDDLFVFKKRSRLKKEYFIRPYQCVPSCLVMYRWLSMFRTIATVEPGLTFYRIWRFRLKHIESGLVFELCDWKAAMSSTFLNGQPKIDSFLNDALELLQLLTHPHFIMHPLGLHPRIERTFHYAIKASAGGCIFRSHISVRSRSKKYCKRTISPALSPTNSEDIFRNHPDNENHFPDIDEMLEQWRMRRQLALLAPSISTFTTGSNSSCSTVTSETEMDSPTDERELTSDCESDFNLYECGYVTNCEYFISQTHSFDTIEEQHSLQASIADKWMFTRKTCIDRIPVLYDIEDRNWYFKNGIYEPMFTYDTESSAKMRKLETEQNSDVTEKHHLQIPNERVATSPRSVSPSCYFNYSSGVLEPIPSSLALYRLICLFELNCSMYSSSDDVSVWYTTMMHKKTGGLINFCDYNGMFQVYVSTTEIISPDNLDVQNESGRELNNLKSEFREAVNQLLELVMSEDFSHPYGTIAGAVA